MATCADCIHYEVCSDYFDATIECGTTCSFWKDRSRFVELPCLLDDKVFYFDINGRIYVQTVKSLTYGLTKTGFVIHSDVDFVSDLFGDRFFHSYEEAEQAFKERENNG